MRIHLFVSLCKFTTLINNIHYLHSTMFTLFTNGCFVTLRLSQHLHNKLIISVNLCEVNKCQKVESVSLMEAWMLLNAHIIHQDYAHRGRHVLNQKNSNHLPILQFNRPQSGLSLSVSLHLSDHEPLARATWSNKNEPCPVRAGRRRPGQRGWPRNMSSSPAGRSSRRGFREVRTPQSPQLLGPTGQRFGHSTV